MKKLKFLFSISVLMLLLFSCEKESDSTLDDISVNKVGELIDGEIKIIDNKGILLKKYDKIALNEGMETRFTQLEIQNLNIEGEYYGLFAYNKDKSVRSVTVLILENNVFNIYRTNGGSITCTTTVCSNNSGCTAIQKTNNLGITYWTCSDCFDGTCTKTTTVTFK